MKLPQKLQCLWNYNREDDKGRFMTPPVPTCKVITQKALVCPDVQASHHPWHLGRARWPPCYSQINRTGTSERSQVELGKLSHFMGEEVEVQRGVRASQCVRDGINIQTQIPWLISWCLLSYHLGGIFDIKKLCPNTTVNWYLNPKLGDRRERPGKNRTQVR